MSCTTVSWSSGEAMSLKNEKINVKYPLVAAWNNVKHRLAVLKPYHRQKPHQATVRNRQSRTLIIPGIKNCLAVAQN